MKDIPRYRAVDPLLLQNNKYIVGVESFADVSSELTALHEAHWGETETLYLKDPEDTFKPDYERAVKLEAAGAMVLFTLREFQSWSLVGNMVFFMQNSMHDSTRFQATEDVFFIAKHHRGRVVLPFLTYVERALKGFGVRCIAISDKQPCGGPDLSKLLGRRGYAQVARLFRKAV